MTHSRRIAVVGLGYVGLPVAISFARTRVPVVGFDVDAARIRELKGGYDRKDKIEPYAQPDWRTMCPWPMPAPECGGADTAAARASSVTSIWRSRPVRL